MCKVACSCGDRIYSTVIQRAVILVICAVLSGCGGRKSSSGSGGNVVVPTTLNASLSPSRFMAGSDVDNILILARVYHPRDAKIHFDQY